MENHHDYCNGKNINIPMAMFNSYVECPEGIPECPAFRLMLDELVDPMVN